MNQFVSTVFLALGGCALVFGLVSCQDDEKGVRVHEPRWESNRVIATESGDSLRVYDPYFDMGDLRLRGQLHCHTVNSDGRLRPNELADLYASKGYDFWTITDHNCITREPSNNRMIWMGNSYEHTASFHACLYRVSHLYSLGEPLNTLGYKVWSEGGYVDYAHPDWNPDAFPYMYQTDAMVSSIQMVNFVEVVNEGFQTTRPFDLMLSMHRRVWAIAVDDLHNLTHLNLGYVEVLARARNADSIWNALRRGNFYATNGPRANLCLSQDGLIRFETDVPAHLMFFGNHGVILKQDSSVNLLTYRIKGDESYVRCEARTVGGGKCYTQAILLLPDSHGSSQ